MKKYTALLLSALFLLGIYGCQNESGKTEGEEPDDTAQVLSKTQEITDADVEECSEEFTVSDFDGYTVTVLGDSIAYGYGLENPGKTRFSALLEKALEAGGGNVYIYNFAVNGMTGSELKELIRQCEEGTVYDDPDFLYPDNDFGTDRGMAYDFDEQDIANCRCAIRNSDAIIISIGGNDILNCISEMSKAFEISEEFGTETLKDYFQYIQNPEKSPEKAYSVNEINSIFKKINALFNSEEAENAFLSTAYGLSNYLSDIFQSIYAVNPDAKIFIQTVYNPFYGISLKFPLIDESVDLSSYGDKVTEKINRSIFESEALPEVTAVDIKAAFDESDEKLTNFGIDLAGANGGSFDFDPHPNTRGQEVISEVYYKAITEAEG